MNISKQSQLSWKFCWHIDDMLVTDENVVEFQKTHVILTQSFFTSKPSVRGFLWWMKTWLTYAKYHQKIFLEPSTYLNIFIHKTWTSNLEFVSANLIPLKWKVLDTMCNVNMKKSMPLYELIPHIVHFSFFIFLIRICS